MPGPSETQKALRANTKPANFLVKDPAQFICIKSEKCGTEGLSLCPGSSFSTFNSITAADSNLFTSGLKL